MFIRNLASAGLALVLVVGMSNFQLAEAKNWRNQFNRFIAGNRNGGFNYRANQSQLQQQFAGRITTCNTMIDTGVNAGQLSVVEEQQLRTMLDQISAQNNSYAGHGYNDAEVQQLAAGLAQLEQLITAAGTNVITRF